MNDDIWVVKVGGSLLELPDLGRRLRNWLDRQAPPRSLLVMGGGATADVIRQTDHVHRLGEERCHWLALRALTLNAHLLAALIPGGSPVTSLRSCHMAWKEMMIPVLDPYPLLADDEGQALALPHSWEVTSDSVAARIAEIAGAGVLVLLKSASAAQRSTPGDWARLGLVDAWLPKAAARLNEVRFVNFREAP